MKNLLVAIMFSAAGASAFAGDVYLFQAHAEGPQVYNPAADPGDRSEIIEWSTDAFFFNQGTTDARVELLDDNDGIQFTIPPQHSVSLSTALPHQTFTFIHASIPDSVVVENALFIGEVPASILPTAPDYRYGKVRLPVFTSLTQPNQPQTHLATYLGSQPSHTNVWIYNGGLSTATAHIEVHRQCDDAVIDEATVNVEAKKSLVIPGMASKFVGCPIIPGMQVWTPFGTYVIVTLDQPSLSFVSTVANGQIPTAMVSVN